MQWRHLQESPKVWANKKLTFASEEDKKNHERMQALMDQLNLAKYRKVAGALGDASAEADASEQVNDW